MTGEPRPNTPKPENWSDELSEALNNVQTSKDCDIWQEIEKLEAHTLDMFKGFL